MARTPIHLNSNLFAAVYVSTTGIQVGWHEIYSICILPLDSQLNPALKVALPFNMPLLISNEEEIDPKYISSSELIDSQTKGINPDAAVDLFLNWFKRLELPPNKKLVPVCCDWPFHSAFLKQWLGSVEFNDCFHESYRDIRAAAAYLNDCAHFRSEQIPFPKQHLSYILSTLKIPRYSRTNTLAQCQAIAEAYKLIIRERFPVTIVREDVLDIPL